PVDESERSVPVHPESVGLKERVRLVGTRALTFLSGPGLLKRQECLSRPRLERRPGVVRVPPLECAPRRGKPGIENGRQLGTRFDATALVAVELGRRKRTTVRVRDTRDLPLRQTAAQ